MRHLVIVGVLVGVVGFGPSAAAQAQTVPVFVTSAGAANGFTDPNKDNQDTVRDLIDQLKDKKVLKVVKSRDEAMPPIRS